MQLHKFPRTPHIEGSRLQPGDEDLELVPVRALAGRRLIVEEKVDGANAGLSFDGDGRLWLQSRGHFLTGGSRERHFGLFKAWAASHQRRLYAALGDRYVLYGEWLYAKHTIFYDVLPHYFLAFDALDTIANAFLSTERRNALLSKLPLVGVPALWHGTDLTTRRLHEMIGPSRLTSGRWREGLREVCDALGLDPQRILAETDPSGLMEGLYIRVEEDGRLLTRCKFIRPTFQSAVTESGSHWLERPIVPNQLRPDADIFRDTR